jgi:S-adenosylmethionine synthetase
LFVDKVMPDADAVVVAAEVAVTAGVVAVAGRVGALAAKEAASEEWSAVMIRTCISKNKKYERMEGGDVLCLVDFV